MSTPEPLVSIIIPTYNRAHLIGETLDSVVAQTYQNWECIVVDDGSTDNTDGLMEDFIARDSRFNYYHRPLFKVKGANACRNHGLDLSQGDYIVFFDSDDLMKSNHLGVKISNILKYDCDYIITKTECFNKKNTEIKIYEGLKTEKITPHNYIVRKVNWLTLDTCIKSEVAKSIRFNENLQSGQEYNYFAKLTYVSTDAKFIDKVITFRRHHNNSIKTTLNTDVKKPKQSFMAAWYTYFDIKALATKETRIYLINKCSRIYMDQGETFNISRKLFYQAVLREKGYRLMFLIFYVNSEKLFTKGNIFRKLFFNN